MWEECDDEEEMMNCKIGTCFWSVIERKKGLTNSSVFRSQRCCDWYLTVELNEIKFMKWEDKSSLYSTQEVELKTLSWRLWPNASIVRQRDIVGSKEKAGLLADRSDWNTLVTIEVKKWKVSRRGDDKTDGDDVGRFEMRWRGQDEQSAERRERQWDEIWLTSESKVRYLSILCWKREVEYLILLGRRWVWQACC